MLKTHIPRIGYGLGTKWYTGDNSSAANPDLIQSIHEALKIGYTHLDAAAMYGTDSSVAQALKTAQIRRENLFVTSKVYKNIENIKQACVDAITRLGVDYLDLWLIHAPFFDRNKLTLEQAWKQMEQLVDEGLVKFIGVSNFQKHHLQELLDLKPKIKPVVNQIEYHPYVHQASRDILDICKANDIVVEAYSPLAPISYQPNGPVDDIVNELATKYNRSPAQILLKWNLSRVDVVITTSSKPERLEDFLHALDDDFQLSNEDIQAIDTAGAKLHFRKFWTALIDQV